MCRIMAMCGELEEGVVSDVLREFGALAESGVVPKGDTPGHKDGWGVVAYGSGDGIVVYEKEPESAAHNARFESAAEKTVAANPKLLIAHLRKASVGKNTPENTQPYACENYSFCHNGTVGDFEKLPLEDELLKLRKGKSDSEWLFYRLVQEMRKSPAILPGAILKNFIGDLQSLDYTAFNTLFSDGRCLLATREANENNAWVKKGNLCEYYYTLYHGASKDGKQHIICSQELPINGIQWSEIPNHAMVCIDLATGKKEIAVV